MEKLLTVRQVADVLQLKEQTVYTYVMRRQLPFIKFGANLRFRESDLQKYIDSKAVPA